MAAFHSLNATATANHSAPDSRIQHGSSEENNATLPAVIPPDGGDEDLERAQYMTGMPFYILFGTLLLAALLSATNVSMLGTVSLVPDSDSSFADRAALLTLVRRLRHP